jgi:hypothetical protein
MASMTSGLYVVTWRDATDTTGLAIDLLDATNKVCLYTDAGTAPAHDTAAAHVTSNPTEVTTGGGYTQDTKEVGGTPTYALGNAGQLKYSWSAAVEWTSSTITANGMIIGKSTGLEPIVSVAFGQNYISTNGTFSISAHANGIFYIDLVP